MDHALRQQGTATAFNRKVSLRAIGHNRTPVVEHHVRDQLEHVDLADPRYRQMLTSVAVDNPKVDLSDPVVRGHGLYWYSLHIVFVVVSRYRMGDVGFLNRLRSRAVECAESQGVALKRIAIMPDPMHLALRGNPSISPMQIAQGLQEATADVAGCRLWEDAFYVGTFGDYDCRAIKGAAGGIQWSANRIR